MLISCGKSNQITIAKIETEKGTMTAVLYTENAPKHCKNFIKLAEEGFYNGLTFHRVEPGFVIQGGDPAGDGTGGPGYTIPPEFGLRHEKGALAMARKPDFVNPKQESSGSQFYICLEPAHQLDGQYSVFGRVYDGMDVAQNIRVGDKILSITIEKQDKVK
ncbi:MAG: peptidylprolyl isomerase [Gemmatimonadetes bacterium]|nr:MAG: peptidylprolyl isomerase [Gemmatimonadota bacterium]